jgi:hypothetical protein
MNIKKNTTSTYHEIPGKKKKRTRCAANSTSLSHLSAILRALGIVINVQIILLVLLSSYIVIFYNLKVK